MERDEDPSANAPLFNVSGKPDRMVFGSREPSGGNSVDLRPRKGDFTTAALPRAPAAAHGTVVGGTVGDGTVVPGTVGDGTVVHGTVVNGEDDRRRSERRQPRVPGSGNSVGPEVTRRGSGQTLDVHAVITAGVRRRARRGSDPAVAVAVAAPPPPPPGWKGAVWTVSRGLIRPGLAAAEADHHALLTRVGRRASICQTVAFAGARGAVGATTITAGCGIALALHRGDRTVALDACVDGPALAPRIAMQSPATIADVIDHGATIERYSAMRAFTSQAPSRLEVVASAARGRDATALTLATYTAALELVSRFYSIVLSDIGGSLFHEANQSIVDRVDQFILVTTPDGAALEAAELAAALIGRRHPERLADGILVINNTSLSAHARAAEAVVTARFTGRVRSIIAVPFDRHLSGPGVIDWNRLHHGTQRAFLELAAAVADGFATPSRRGGDRRR